MTSSTWTAGLRRMSSDRAQLDPARKPTRQRLTPPHPELHPDLVDAEQPVEIYKVLVRPVLLHRSFGSGRDTHAPGRLSAMDQTCTPLIGTTSRTKCS